MNSAALILQPWHQDILVIQMLVLLLSGVAPVGSDVESEGQGEYSCEGQRRVRAVHEGSLEMGKAYKWD